MKKIYWVLGLSTAFILLSTFWIKFNFHEFEKFENDEQEEQKKDQPNKFKEYFTAITQRFGKHTSYPKGYRFLEFEKAVQQEVKLKKGNEILPWVSRGPHNVAGRVRGLVIDPSDNTHKTWFAGSASGGIWKTIDAGASWINMTTNLPNLSTSTLAISISTPNVLYAGTGEGFRGAGMVRGDGIFKSTDKGLTWTLLKSTSNNEDFFFVNKILVSPTNENIVIVSTNTGIFKSMDGGVTFSRKYSASGPVQDLEADPTDFNVLYGGENSNGVIKSVDMGNTWSLSSSGIGGCLRVELAISPINPSKIFACMETSQDITNVYVSIDKGGNWKKFNNTSSVFANYLGDQGWFDNTLACHPYNENIVFIGGIYLGKYEFTNAFSESDPQVIRVDTVSTASFLSFINFGGDFLGGGMQTGDKNKAIQLFKSDWSSVEIRFGTGKHQKAHRFTVPVTSGTNGDGGAGVDTTNYEYKDYVDVPFEAWDTKNNRQLMISFRDQERDGTFNLIKRDANNDAKGREYIYVNSIPYAANPDANITRNGGHSYKQTYFFWPTLADSGIWNPATLPESKISIQYGTLALQSGKAAIVSDARGDQGSLNDNLHADHHNLVMIPTDAATQKFWIVDANDGGIGLSQDGGETWAQLTNGMISTQFYGVDKKTGAQEYIGGMQDNGTWQSPIGKVAASTSAYAERLGGDGFDVVWHPVKTNQIIGSLYNNRFYLSRDGGVTWNSASKNINEDGPFITRIGYSPQKPDILFAVGKDGVWRSNAFGYHPFGGWEKKVIGTGWAVGEEVTSQHNVKVSLANPDVVWAGAGMSKDPVLTLFVSTNSGSSFTPATIYNDVEMGYISGLATHPTNPNEAFALFSFYGAPKILRTMNLGKTWQDITGFGKKDTSNTGFPNVAVHSLMVMPFDTSWIWAGTEIGLFESRDNGATWAYANNGLPAVSIWQIKTVDNEVVVATHGRGIWSTTIPGSKLSITKAKIESFPLKAFPIPAINDLTISFNDTYKGNVRVQLHNLSGKQLYSKMYFKSNGSFSEVIDVSNFAKGHYILSVDFANKIATRKITVQ